MGQCTQNKQDDLEICVNVEFWSCLCHATLSQPEQRKSDGCHAGRHALCVFVSNLANRGRVLLHLLQEVSQKAPVCHDRLNARHRLFRYLNNLSSVLIKQAPEKQKNTHTHCCCCWFFFGARAFSVALGLLKISSTIILRQMDIWRNRRLAEQEKLHLSPTFYWRQEREKQSHQMEVHGLI